MTLKIAQMMALWSVLLVGSTLLLPAPLAADPAFDVEIGIARQVRLGKWVPVFIETDGSFTPKRFEVQVLDGDDTPVIYCGELIADSHRPNRFQAWARIGRVYGNVEVRLLDAEGTELAAQSKSFRGENRVGEFIDSTRKIFLTIEEGETLRGQLESLSSFGSNNTTRVVLASQLNDQLPLHRIGYDSVDVVFLVTHEASRNEQLTSQQMDALEEWVKGGGKLILSVARHSESLMQENGLLARFAPGEFTGLGELTNSKRLELLSPDTSEQLIARRGQPIPSCVFDSVEGVVELDDGKDLPLMIRRAKGLGEIVFLSFDIDAPRIVSWSGFPSWLGRVLQAEEGQFARASSSRNPNLGSSVSHFGYNDMVGQLRTPLETFTQVRFVAFTLVACLIGLYILCIGPGDYFFLQKLTGKMELTWITFPLLVALFCGLAYWLAGATRPSEIQVNKIEILDVDSVEGRTRASVWANLYSPTSSNCSLGIDVNPEIGFETDSAWISWHGLPGDGMGGMRTRANSGLLKTAYRTEFESGPGNRLNSVLQAIPLQDASTRPVFCQWWSDNPMRVRSRLRLDSRLDGQLVGTFTNPFDFRLNRCKLVFDNWAYVLDQSLEPGETIDITAETREKNLKSFMTRRTSDSEKKERSNASPWNPEDTNLRRIMDMMMFYDGAGGKNYTGLSHAYQSFVDMTDYVKLGRAVLVGEVDKTASIVMIDGESVESNYDQALTIVRVVFPVEMQARR